MFPFVNDIIMSVLPKINTHFLMASFMAIGAHNFHWCMQYAQLPAIYMTHD